MVTIVSRGIELRLDLALIGVDAREHGHVASTGGFAIVARIAAQNQHVERQCFPRWPIRSPMRAATLLSSSASSCLSSEAHRRVERTYVRGERNAAAHDECEQHREHDKRDAAAFCAAFCARGARRRARGRCPRGRHRSRCRNRQPRPRGSPRGTGSRSACGCRLSRPRPDRRPGRVLPLRGGAAPAVAKTARGLGGCTSIRFCDITLARLLSDKATAPNRWPGCPGPTALARKPFRGGKGAPLIVWSNPDILSSLS